MVDQSTKEMVTTKAEGTGLQAELDPFWSQLMQDAEDEAARRNLREGNARWVHPLRLLRAHHEGVRRLQMEGIPLANITNTQAEISATFTSYMHGQTTEANLIHENGNVYSVRLASGIYQVADDPDCPHYWRNIMEFGETCPKYNLRCCSGTTYDDFCTLSVYEFCG